MKLPNTININQDDLIDLINKSTTLAMEFQSNQDDRTVAEHDWFVSFGKIVKHITGQAVEEDAH